MTMMTMTTVRLIIVNEGEGDTDYDTVDNYDQNDSDDEDDCTDNNDDDDADDCNRDDDSCCSVS